MQCKTCAVIEGQQPSIGQEFEAAFLRIFATRPHMLQFASSVCLEIYKPCILHIIYHWFVHTKKKHTDTRATITFP